MDSSSQVTAPSAQELVGAERVLVGQYTDQRASQCNVNDVGPATHWYCPTCTQMISYDLSPFLTECAAHGASQPADELEGLILFPKFISEEYESQLVAFLDATPSRFEGWKVSQSGKNKQDFGPQPNFKKKKVKVSESFVGVPQEYKALGERVEFAASDVGESGPFQIAQYSALEYLPETKSHLNPHIDDTWLWGGRVVGVSLLSDSRMTFVTKSLSVVDVPLPRRAMFILSGTSRYEALHGIRGEHITSRRISITIRELSQEWLSEGDPELVSQIRTIFSTWI